MENVAPHGPENADHELRIAYNAVIDACIAYLWDQSQGGVTKVNAQELMTMYRHAFRAHRKGDRLAAERWARTAKHLSRALLHEAKISYLELRTDDLPYLTGATGEEYNLREHSNTAQDLLNSVATHIPPGQTEMPEPMKRYLARGKEHLEKLNEPGYRHELLRAERTNAAQEYGRALECMALAYEAEAAERAA